ncbi:branched-chain amino acid transport system permease protein [Rhodococcus sp. 27YEA15]|uniref:branched-chain amino acid ABC transporter ATP-binding protein/permease n=1 Tax=Rhodococcus sp. 27YEA15 TaxID=3156259 RepID=UPI003C7A19D0
MTAWRLDRIPSWFLPLVAGLVLVAVPWFGTDPLWVRQLTLIAIYTMLVAGLNITFGYAGMLSLGQVAMFALGAYTTGILMIRGWSMLSSLAVAVIAAGVVGFVTGLPGLRLGGWGLGMTSFFLVLLIPDITQIFTEQTGGLYGLTAIPAATIGGRVLDKNEFYAVCIIAMVIVLALLRNLMLSSFGNSLRILRRSPVLATSLGLNTNVIKAKAFVISSLPAGLGGGLVVCLDHFIAPTSFTLTLGVLIIAASVLGGSESIYGAFFGVAVIRLGTWQVTAFDKYSLVAYGLFLVVGGVFFSRGIAGLADQHLSRWRSRPTATAESREQPGPIPAIEVQPIPGGVLEIHGLTKHFQGNQALNDVSITAVPGQVTGLVGANGSGKTTLLNLISGLYRPTSGDVSLAGERLSGRAPHLIARRGVARTFQTPVLPDGMTVLEAVASARYANDAVSIAATILRLPAHRRAERSRAEAARQALRLVGCEDLADQDAAGLALGTRRRVEVARALAADPHLILLDEAASGLDEGEVEELASVIRRVADAGATVLLVEHNFKMVCSVSDRIYVLESGRLLAEGTADEIQANAAVAESYLGQLPDADELGATTNAHE